MFSRLSLALTLFVVPQISFAQSTPATEPAITFHSRAAPLSLGQCGPFAQTGGGALVCLKDDLVFRSSDGGATWRSTPFAPGRPLRIRPEQALLRMRDGTLVIVFLDDADKRWHWNNETKSADADVHLYVWAARSTDDGSTWSDVQRIQDGYSGAIRDLIETADGTLVVPVQQYSTEHARHVIVPYYSKDAGKTWTRTCVLDVEGRGHHDGAMEATLVERKDRSLWMLIRTNRDCFYESISKDAGLTWTDPVPTKIAASSSPGLVKRLASGRLVLLWNRVDSDSGEPTIRRGDQHAAFAGSWHRGELSMAFSEDDGQTWSAPAVIARRHGAWLSYPYLLEREPGVLWITTMQGGVELSLREADFVPAKP